MKYSAILFDLDGTVADTLHNITAAVNHTMEHFGMKPFSPARLRPHLGWGVDYLLAALMPELTDQQLREIMAYYRPYYASHTTDQVVPYPGIHDTLLRLRKAGLKLAIISNKPDAALQPIVAAFFRDTISLSMGEVHDVPRKPAPDMLIQAARKLEVPLEGCLYVGDTQVDIQTAENTGIDCLCVTWGFRTRQELEAAGAKHIADSPEDLLDFVLGSL